MASSRPSSPPSSRSPSPKTAATASPRTAAKQQQQQVVEDTPRTAASALSEVSGFSEISTRYEPTTPARALDFASPSSEISTPTSEVIRRAVSAARTGVTGRSTARLRGPAAKFNDTESPLRFGDLSAISSPALLPAPSASSAGSHTPNFQASLCEALQRQLSLDAGPSPASSLRSFSSVAQPESSDRNADTSEILSTSFHSARQSIASSDAGATTSRPAPPNVADLSEHFAVSVALQGAGSRHLPQATESSSGQNATESASSRYSDEDHGHASKPQTPSTPGTNMDGLDDPPAPPAEMNPHPVISLLSDSEDDEREASNDDDDDDDDSDFVLNEGASASNISAASWTESPIQVPVRARTQLRRRAARKAAANLSACPKDREESFDRDADTLSAGGEPKSPSVPASSEAPLPPPAQDVSASEFDKDSPLLPPKSTVKRSHKRVVFMSSSSEDEDEDIDLYDTSGNEEEGDDGDDESGTENLAAVANESLENQAGQASPRKPRSVRRAPRTTEPKSSDAYDLDDSFIASEGLSDDDDSNDDDYEQNSDDDDVGDSEADSVVDLGSDSDADAKTTDERIDESFADDEPDAAVSLTKATASAARQRPTRTTSVPDTAKITKSNRDEYTRALLKDFNREVFANKIPQDLEVTWNPRLTRTAGSTFTKTVHGKRVARIELSTKVLSSGDRLNTTFLHELCHVAAWVVNASQRPPHGAVFQKWAAIATRAFPQYEVTTLHTYSLHAPYHYQCTKCQTPYTRHSKSINVETQSCGKCSNGKLKYLGEFDSQGNKKKEREKTAYQLYVRDNYSAVQQEIESNDSTAVMKVIAKRWRETKSSGAATQRSGSAGTPSSDNV